MSKRFLYCLLIVAVVVGANVVQANAAEKAAFCGSTGNGNWVLTYRSVKANPTFGFMTDMTQEYYNALQGLDPDDYQTQVNGYCSNEDRWPEGFQPKKAADPSVMPSFPAELPVGEQWGIPDWAQDNNRERACLVKGAQDPKSFSIKTQNDMNNIKAKVQKEGWGFAKFYRLTTDFENVGCEVLVDAATPGPAADLNNGQSNLVTAVNPAGVEHPISSNNNSPVQVIVPTATLLVPTATLEPIAGDDDQTSACNWAEIVKPTPSDNGRRPNHTWTCTQVEASCSYTCDWVKDP